MGRENTIITFVTGASACRPGWRRGWLASAERRLADHLEAPSRWSPAICCIRYAVLESLFTRVNSDPLSSYYAFIHTRLTACRSGETASAVP